MSGQIFWDGKPAPFGSIVFTPDKDKGNSGPQGTARIVNGRYDTARQGRGTVGGPHKVLVIISGTDKPEETELSGAFAEQTFELDLPRSVSQQDFKIDRTQR